MYSCKGRSTASYLYCAIVMLEAFLTSRIALVQVTGYHVNLFITVKSEEEL
jgi:hypothetical protein